MKQWLSATGEKYLAVSNILGKVQSELYNTNSFLGKWMSSKNSLELINGNLFAHWGIHPDVADSKLSLNQINQIIRDNYYKPHYPKTENTTESLLNSTKTGICWYRGYCKEDLTQEQVESVLKNLMQNQLQLGTHFSQKWTVNSTEK